MTKTETKQKPVNNKFTNIILVLIFIMLSFIAYSFYNTNQNLAAMDSKLTKIQDITKSTETHVKLINDFTGQKALSNPRKDALDKCIKVANSYNGSSQDHVALMISCIGLYLAD